VELTIEAPKIDFPYVEEKHICNNLSVEATTTVEMLQTSTTAERLTKGWSSVQTPEENTTVEKPVNTYITDMSQYSFTIEKTTNLMLTDENTNLPHVTTNFMDGEDTTSGGTKNIASSLCYYLFAVLATIHLR